MRTNSLQPPAAFAYGSDGRPYATVFLQSVDGNYYPVRMLADSGNDVTLITHEAARMLGLRQEMGQPFSVEGVAPGVMTQFMLFQVPMRIGNYQPFYATIGVGDVSQNLLGRRDVFSRFDVTYTADKQVVFTCSRCSGGQIR